MDDARGLQYEIEFDTGDADSSIDQLGDGLDNLERRMGAAEMGAQRMGAGVVSACNSGAAGADHFTEAIDRTGESMDDMADSTRTAADTAHLFGGGLGDAEEDAERFRSKIRETAEEAEDLGDAFRETMADGLEAGQSIAKSFGTGITGAIDFSRNKVKTFVSDTVKGAQNIATKFKHPIQTIRTDLVKALRGAQDSTEDLGAEANNSANDLRDMGDAGETAGNQVSKAIKGAVAAFAGMEIIKQSTDLLKQFGQAALSAYSDTEATAKQFDALFSTSASGWVDNFSESVHRSTGEVMDFMVQNGTMYRDLGLTGDAVEELSALTTSLAYDFGNAFSMMDADALGLVQSAIQGDTAALEAYGISLDKTALKQSAAALGLGENIDALDDAAMAQVRLNALLDKTTEVQKAAIEQTGGLTNSVKSLNGIWTDFLTKSGSKFAPAIENLIGAVVDEWPKIEPILLSFVDVLADGISDVAPSLIDLAQNLIPSVTSVLGTLASAAGPVLSVFSSIAGTALPPLVEIMDSLVSYVIPPLVSTLETLNADAIQPLIPVIQEIARQVLPVFGQAFSAAGQIIGQLASSVVPPLVQILGVLIQAIQPLVSVAQQFISALLPPLMTLISAAGKIISGVFLPAVSALSPALSVAADILGVITDALGKVVGWLADGAGKVAGFFSGLFGGAKESSAAVEELGNNVTDLGAATENIKFPSDSGQMEMPDLTLGSANTEPFNQSITKAAQEADTSGQASAKTFQASYENSMDSIGTAASSTFAQAASDAEDSWSRMADAAREGAQIVVSSIEEIGAAANKVGSINLSISSADIPSHASGTPSFGGGWTRMNEEGGELAYLPSGTAIIPADQTDKIINASTTNNSNSTQYTDSSTFAPSLNITLGSGAGGVDEEALLGRIRDELEKFWREKKEEEAHKRALQGAYAR